MKRPYCIVGSGVYYLPYEYNPGPSPIPFERFIVAVAALSMLLKQEVDSDRDPYIRTRRSAHMSPFLFGKKSWWPLPEPWLLKKPLFGLKPLSKEEWEKWVNTYSREPRKYYQSLMMDDITWRKELEKACDLMAYGHIGKEPKRE